MEILSAIGSIAGVVAAILFVIFRKGAQKYVDEKAKNLATIEDTEKMSKEVERVKTDYLQRSHAWKYIFEYEYKVLKDVWDATWDFQANARSLRPMWDHLPEDPDKKKAVFIERYNKYSETVNKFKDAVIKNQPFMPTHVYEACMLLRETVIELEVDFEMSINDDISANWKKILECGKIIDDKIENLNVSIREHIYGKLKAGRFQQFSLPH